MRILIFGFLFFVSCWVNAQSDTLNHVDSLTGKKTGYWIIYGKTKPESGFSPESIIEEGSYLDGKKTGIWKTYYAIGTLKAEIEYLNNRPNGKFNTFYENGCIKEKGKWKGTHYDGKVTSYFEECGCKSKEMFFDKYGTSTRDTVRIEYFQFTCNAKKVEYFKKHGKYVEYDSLGNVVKTQDTLKVDSKKKYYISEVQQEMEFNKKDTSKLRYNPDETINKSYVKVNEKTTDTIKVNHNKNMNTYYNWDCKCYRYLSVEEQNGYHKLYNELQQLKTDGEFKNGKLTNGKFYIYDNEDLLMRVEVYKNGKYHSDAQLD